MDEFLAALGAQAMRHAIRSGIALTSSYAISQCSRLLNSVGNPKLHAELKTQQQLLEGKLRVLHRQEPNAPSLRPGTQLISSADRSSRLLSI